jgi:acyl dehydratase
MPIDYASLKTRRFEDVEQHYTSRDTILYALSVGAGSLAGSDAGFSAVDDTELPFVYENGLHALPTMAVVLGYPGFWLREPLSGIDWRAVLHVEQDLVLHCPLDGEGAVIGSNRIDEIFDRGQGRGAILVTKREITDLASGAPLASLASTELCRGEGGFGGPSPPPRPRDDMPARAADNEVTLTVDPRAALLYRLNGDDNPLHIDSSVARSMGFERPILHGLCTFGMAGYALQWRLFPDARSVVRRLKVRFTSPVYPGERLCMEIWRENEGMVRFRVRAPLRGVVVIDHGLMLYKALCTRAR